MGGRVRPRALRKRIGEIGSMIRSFADPFKKRKGSTGENTKKAPGVCRGFKVHESLEEETSL